ncbi:F-BAR and double SH3 domains protein 1-like [Narcine bancroftii]|uniref:F-BAR and double SH3 domains protein 1-like n=1 Tax=Narcine bancroftii TaxID=1343680 RepID=UPI00383188ED
MSLQDGCRCCPGLVLGSSYWFPVPALSDSTAAFCFRSYSKQRACIEKEYGQALQRLAAQYLRKDSSRGKADASDGRTTLGAWRTVVEATAQLGQARSVAANAYRMVSVDAARTSRAAKDLHLKCSEQLVRIQAELMEAVKELNKAKKQYGQRQRVADIAQQKAAEAQAKTKKSEFGIFHTKTSLQKLNAKLSSRLWECNCHVTEARNEYLLTISAVTAHLAQYIHADLPQVLKSLTVPASTTIPWQSIPGSHNSLPRSSLLSPFYAPKRKVPALLMLPHQTCFPNPGNILNLDNDIYERLQEFLTLIGKTETDTSRLGEECFQNVLESSRKVVWCLIYTIFFPISLDDPIEFAPVDIQRTLQHRNRAFSPSRLCPAIKHTETLEQQLTAHGLVNDSGILLCAGTKCVLISISREVDLQLFLQDNPVFSEAIAFTFQPVGTDKICHLELDVETKDGESSLDKEARKWATKQAMHHKVVAHGDRILQNLEQPWHVLSEEEAAVIELKMEEVKESIRKAEVGKRRAVARLALLREAGVEVDASTMSQAGEELERERRLSEARASQSLNREVSEVDFADFDEFEDSEETPEFDDDGTLTEPIPKRCTVLFSYQAGQSDELTITEGEQLEVIDDGDVENWVKLVAGMIRGRIVHWIVDLAAVHDLLEASGSSSIRKGKVNILGWTPSSRLQQMLELQFQLRGGLWIGKTAVALPRPRRSPLPHWLPPTAPALEGEGHYHSAPNQDSRRSAALRQLSFPEKGWNRRIQEGCLARALYGYQGQSAEELCFPEGALIRILHTGEWGVEDRFWQGDFDGRVGVFPSLLVEMLRQDAAEPVADLEKGSPPFSPPPLGSDPEGVAQQEDQATAGKHGSRVIGSTES